jgi:hypothetical protein
MPETLLKCTYIAQFPKLRKISVDFSYNSPAGVCRAK